MRRSVLLAVEQLEDRCTPTTWGNPWPDPGHLTLSFVPDGTLIDGTPSSLFATLNAATPTATWEQAILRAFQTWAVNSNISLSVTSDGGQPLGTAGAIQGDSRFGDIRIAAAPLASDVTAVATPFDVTAGTLAGDVVLNSSLNFGVGGQGTYDVYTVLLHEAGHAFGLGDSSVTTSVMYDTYLGPRTGLGTADVAALQALYGPRSQDPAGNATFATATRLNLLANANGSLALAVQADITSLQDTDVYAFSTLLALGGVNVQLQTSGISLLTSRLSVYDSAGNPVAAALATDPLNGTLTLHLSSVRPLATYYVKVASGRQDVFGIGTYALQVQWLPLANSLLGGLTSLTSGLAQTVTPLLAADPLHLDSSFTTAELLPPLFTRADSSLNYGFRASLSGNGDVDYFQVQAPAGPANVLTAMVWGLPAPGQPTLVLKPIVRVYNQQQNLVPADVLVNDGYSYTVQIAGAVPGAHYFVEVLPANPAGPSNAGNYFLGVQFTLNPVVLQTLTSGSLSAVNPQATGTLTVEQSQVFHFVLSANGPNSSGQGSVQLTVYDLQGNLLFTLTAPAGTTVTGNVELKKGSYKVRLLVLAPAGVPLPTLAYQLRGSTLTDPIGPETSDPTADPSSDPSSTSSTDSSTTTSDSSSTATTDGSTTADGSTTTSSTYYWTGGDPSGVGTQDPTSDPYSTT